MSVEDVVEMPHVSVHRKIFLREVRCVAAKSVVMKDTCFLLHNITRLNVADRHEPNNMDQ